MRNASTWSQNDMSAKLGFWSVFNFVLCKNIDETIPYWCLQPTNPTFLFRRKPDGQFRF